MQIAEPMTTLTDYLLAVVYGSGAVALAGHARRTGARAQRLLAASLASTAAAALLGGTSHGFGPSLSAWAASGVWLATMWAIGLAAYLLLRASFAAAPLGRSRRWLTLAAHAQLGAFLLWTVRHREFVWVMVDYLPVMLFVLALQAWQYRRREPSAAWIAGAVALSLVAAAVQRGGVSLHPNLNHNDLYHLIQTGAAWLLYRGGLLLRDRSAAA